jgi:hypothetical protein
MGALLLAVVLGLSRVAPTPQEPAPRVLLLVREILRPDSAAVYATNEATIAQLCVQLKCPHPYVALTPRATHETPTEVWWLNTFASPDDEERVSRAWESVPEVLAQLRPLGDRKEGLRRTIGTTRLTYREDLSAETSLDLAGARFVVIAVDTGHPSRRAHAVAFASPDSEFIAIQTARTLAAADSLATRMGAAARIFDVQPRWSFPSARWVSTDPTFWRPASTPRIQRQSHTRP